MSKKNDLLPGTLDLLILTMLKRAPMHGYGIALAIKRGAQKNANNQVFSFLFGNANAPPGVNAAYQKRGLPPNVLRILQNMRSRSKK